jgi:hypothetical protein
VLLVAGLAFAAAALLLVANVRQYQDFQREIGGRASGSSSSRAPPKRRREAEQSRAALASFSVSSLAQESRGLLRIVAGAGSLDSPARELERTLPPEVRVSRLTPKLKTRAVTLSSG